MKHDELNRLVALNYDFDLATIITFLKLRHGDAQEFKSATKEIMLGGYPTVRLVDSPEKRAFYDELRATIRGFAKEGAEWANLIEPIIAAYYNTCRREHPEPGKIKEGIPADD